ncbi:DUF1929 domain-containing protein [Schlegelella sp. S2-27]|uniref:DUF1929 domain-containing protein n=1 Tax=Caldimonas mangrovi TaxID=2944811 RepID=A0ABT0YS21_9BURK|nr:galactose oxidase-like domain-containing protein [Caldimonas mangrovi]MCM5681536.1 DUF1929 domain-containing protein [Caldimonas mangrovi]
MPGPLSVCRLRLVASGLAIAVLASCGGAASEPEQHTAVAPPAATEQAAAARSVADIPVDDLQPAPDAHRVGMWTPLANWPLLAIHANVLPDGKVLSWGSSLSESEGAKALQFAQWDPSFGLQGTAHEVFPSPAAIDSFCSASTIGVDGLVLIVGGNTFWKTAQWDPERSLLVARASQMHQPRWYGSLVRLPDDRVVVVGGNNIERPPAAYGDTPEIFSAAEGWRPLLGARSPEAFGAVDGRWFYPRAFLAPDGRVFGISNDLMWRLDTSGAGQLEVLGTAPHRLGVTGTAVMFRPGRILLAGGGTATIHSGSASAGAAVVDLRGDLPQGRPVAPMKHARNHLNSVLLPDGKVLVTGGTRYGNAGDTAVYAAESWDPDTEQWTELAPAAEIRVYHSVSLLLPSGAVLNAGGGAPGPVFAKNAQVYFPPYFFKQQADGTVTWADRPAIRQASAYAGYGPGADSTIRMADWRRIRSVALVSLAAVTHGHSTDLRYVPVPFWQKGNRLRLRFSEFGPAQVPPGHYQLHVVDDQGVPSAAAIVEFRSGAGNVAAEGTASQSSEVWPAQRALDGVLNSYASTEDWQHDPWWRLDFPSSRPVAGVMLFSRQEQTCSSGEDCPGDLRDVTVSLLDDAGVAVWSSELLNPQNALQSPGRLNVDVRHAAGTAVRARSIVVSRRSDVPAPETDETGHALSLAEVEVREGPVNLALRRPARHTGTLYGMYAGLAVDGNYAGELGSKRLSLTVRAYQPWWEVDLRAVRQIDSIRLWGRIDTCCAAQLDFYVLVSDTPFPTVSLADELARPGVRSYHVPSLERRRAVDIAMAAGQTGRYVRVWLNGENSLALAEVEVFGR